ncbi:tRNA pseudouridine13 synthase [Haloplanus vescus]|uniref:Probable tRNA pseudouridine synthase D n=1 Tax=Haloplanus vescus TaxID=555874 RepID=A0A1H3XC57_9EURY|nr:tRNA pseudouridine(13) synthase TruD [Haloplanus vescus]SDZ96913.1 tRNA pseudouridine13 synthase [Haloplanus vescus]
MRDAHPLERQVGIDHYVSDGPGVGGRLRDDPSDFRVRELETITPEPLDADSGSYPILLVRATLTDWDTNDFASALSDAMGISRERVSWAGTKDKRAVTTQLFSIRDATAEDLPDLSGVDIDPLGRIGRDLEFGDLAGNAFEIRIADAKRPEAVGDVTDDLRAFGGGSAAVPNVFGHQRFGSQRPVTHEVGLHVVREEWREAVLTYVGNPAETEPDRTQQARATVEDVAASADPDWQQALDAMPGHLGYERSMLHTLVENGGETPADFRDALETVPWNLQRLFVNAAQSYAFNQILSERLRRGLPFDRPVAGDVVCFADADAPEGLALPDTDRLQRVDEERVDVVTRHCERGRAFVTAPLVGTETELGDGEPGEIEREVLGELDLAPDDFDLPGNFDSSGTRRAILVEANLSVERDPLTISFSLPRGSYATAVLREYLKVDPRDL